MYVCKSMFVFILSASSQFVGACVFVGNNFELVAQTKENNPPSVSATIEKLCMFSKSPCSNLSISNIDRKKIKGYSVFYIKKN